MKSNLTKAFKTGIGLLIFIILFLPVGFVTAQDQQPPGPIYIVQEGDTLWNIAQRFGVPVNELVSFNQIADPSNISPGDELVIPGLEGVQGVLETKTVPYGEDLLSLSRRYQIPMGTLSRLNHLTSPNELYSGSDLILPESNSTALIANRVSLKPGETMLELAASQGVNPWSLVTLNGLKGTWDGIPGDVLRSPFEGSEDGPGAFPGEITGLEVTPLPIKQGGTFEVKLTADDDLSITGAFLGHDLNFFKDKDGTLIALQGVHALTEPGYYPLELSGSLEDGTPLAFSQPVYVADGGYHYETLTVDPKTLDPATTKPEDDLWDSLASAATPQRYWQGGFQSPIPPVFANCFPSFFGNRRSYNGGPYTYYHTGLDFCGGVGTDIYAVASGVVVFAGPLRVRGNATMVDNGWGIYTGYMHQSEILVQEGDQVEAGQLIGRIGNTGRVTGPHLHLEVFVGGVQVDPMEWLEKIFP